MFWPKFSEDELRELGELEEVEELEEEKKPAKKRGRFSLPNPFRRPVISLSFEELEELEEIGELEEEEKPAKKRAGFSIPNPFRRRIISLSIEGITLRILSFDGGKIERWASVPFNPIFLVNGFVADPIGLGQVIRIALIEREFGKGRLVTALPGLGSVSRVLNVPRVDKGRLGGVVDREARRVMSISPETSHLVWQALPGKAVQQQVYVLATPKEPLYSLVEAIKVAGITPKIVDLKPLALARAVNQQNAIIANGESNSIELAIIVDDIPRMVRSVYLGAEVMNRERVAIQLAEELSRSISYYNDSNRANPLDRDIPIYLTGEAAEDPRLAIMVSDLAKRRVAPLEPALKLPPDFPLAQYMVNIGLVLKAI